MAKAIIPEYDEPPLSVARRCDAYYACPKDPDGKRLGPLVGYAGKYDTPKGERQLVGDVYLNFAMMERHGAVLRYCAHMLHSRFMHREHRWLYDQATGFIGAPEGGKALAATLAMETSREYLYPEKKVTQLASDTLREQSILRFDRHEPMLGEAYILTEDVCNNFRTTEDMIELIESYGAAVLAVVCFLNRSLEVDTEFSIGGRRFPVISIVRQPIHQYRQDDPAVAADIATGNVALKPKLEWARLKKAMEEHRTMPAM